MKNWTQSLQGLPPKQVLALALMEKQKRERTKRERKEALRLAHVNASSTESAVPPEILENATSLVLLEGHPLHDLLHKKADYKVYWGGRASAKSWGIAEALIRKATYSNIRVLCTREFQVSIKDSSLKLLEDTIDRLGLRSWFKVTTTSITSLSGAEFIFKGLHNNTQGIRSTEGIDIVWVEEAQSVSEASWRSLLPTIRKEGAEVWISFNLMDESDATYQRFVVHAQQDWIVHKISYKDNPFFSSRSRADMESDKARDFHLYEHIWEGMPLKVSDAIIFNRKYVVREFDDNLWQRYENRGTRLFFGIDFGFAQDPLACHRSFPIEKDVDGKRRLYISHEAYAKGVEIRDIAELLDEKLPDVRSWPMFGDNSRPETISDLRGQGFNIQPADKWAGCVEDGIAHFRGFDEIVIHPRCEGLIQEARLYRYKTDPKQVDAYGNPKVLPIVVDANNHAWDGLRYAYNGYIQRTGAMGAWARLAKGQ